MSYNEFDETLEKLGLNKKDFANMVKMSYTSVTNWKQNTEVAGWVDSWLENYAKAKALEKITKVLKPYINE
ncbi:hypothetical protein [Helicobacter mesocricetorum]|uniref:hypothetical protein n=1 Tax=Helicobacter mesocricetorum TaxID=87012 RepID=UPI000CF1C6E0|nr:hypothetical protein [Helicobacter mesocricetorum]